MVTRQAVLMDDQLLRALADPLRLQFVELLANEQLCTCHLVELTGATQTNVSNHLKLLRQTGIVETEPAGRYTYYRLVPDRLEQLSAGLSQLADRARLALIVKRPCG